MLTPAKAKKLVLEWWHVASLSMALIYELRRSAIQPLVVEVAKGVSEIAKNWK